MLDHCSKHFIGCHSKKRMVFKIATFVLRFFDGRHVSLHNILLQFRFVFNVKFFLVQDGILWALFICRPLFSLNNLPALSQALDAVPEFIILLLTSSLADW